MKEFEHIPVLLNECIEGLKIKEKGIYVDGTLGGAGHSFRIATKLNNTGTLIGIDRDAEAIQKAKETLKEFNNIIYVQDGILLDLGVSSYQIDEETRGFSYTKNSPLDMRMDKNQKLTAEYVVNEYTEEELANIIYKYGEEKFSRQIARRICEYRKEKRIQTTSELVEIIEKSVPRSSTGGHPAKRTFQAIRIEVNNEIEPLYNTVKNAIDVLKPQGRLCIITFHSLEDRAVKEAYQDSVGKCTCPPDLPYCVCGNKPEGKIITKKPILPTEKEMEINSRSKSAKLRIFEKI